MIAAWMVYCSLCALGLFAAAALAERALLTGRGPVRFVWIGAVALSLLVPAAAFRFAPRPLDTDPTPGASQAVVRDQVLGTTLSASAPIAQPPRSSSPGRDWRARLARLDAPLAVAWATLSLAVALNLFGGILVLARMRRRWQRRNVLGVPVFVSERTGPAVVGAVTPAIVMPVWALALEPPQLALLLRHEQEHRRAGDGRLLAAAQLALIAMPWNIALWWQILGLRAAVELDCDARVLRDADARSYGDLLLEVARPRRGPVLRGATAFAERATQLERRIRVLARHRARTPRAARTMAACIALAAVTVAWVAPRPRALGRATATAGAPAPATTPVERTAVMSDPVGPSDAKAPAPPNDKPRLDSLAVTGRDGARRTPPSPRTEVTRAPAGQGGGAQDVPTVVETVFRMLFDGIALTPDQAAAARDILTRAQRVHIDRGESVILTRFERLLKTAKLQARRDSGLRALLTNDADRAIFDARVAQRSGSGPRSGGPGSDASGDGPRRGGGGGAGRGRAGGPGGSAASTDALSAMAEATFQRLFAGIQLTADQESKARDLITGTQQELRVQTPLSSVGESRVTGDSVLVRMPTESESALLALLSSDADRAKLRSRIVSIP